MPLSLEVEKIQDQDPHCEFDDYYYEEEDKEERQEEEEEEEALSLCDLPVTTNTNIAGNEEAKEFEIQTGDDFDFDFGSLIGSINALESEMCTAEQVFSGGQLLPFRHSVSSDGTGISGFRNTSRNVSRSESMDRGFGSRSTSSRSSRSSSTRSHYSTSSGCNSTASCSIKTIPFSKPKTRINNFHSHPSPKPQIRVSGAHFSTSMPHLGTKKSTMWDVLRLGLVRTPEIELQDIKVRHTSTYNKYNNNNNNNKSFFKVSNAKIGDLLLERDQRYKKLSRNQKGGIFRSCKCSTGAIEPMSTRINGYFSTETAIDEIKSSRNQDQVVKNKDKDLAQKKHQQQQTHKHVRQGKQAMSHHRTFEWLLRDVSHASVLNP